MSFSSLGLQAAILKAVQEAGYSEPTPIQAAAIPQLMAGQDLIGIAQTGTGKTAAFVLPILHRLASSPLPPGQQKTRALVVAPTRELAVQIEENVRAYAKHLPLRTAKVFGGVGEHPQILALDSGTDIIIATPGRLLDLMNQRHGDFSQLQFLVLDEADRMLDMGFLPDIRRIVRALPQKRQTMLFSATLSKDIEAVTREFLRSPKTVEIGRRASAADTVAQCLYPVARTQKAALLAHLLRNPDMETVLVFVRMKHAADRLTRLLQRDGVRAAALHSNRSQAQRQRALNEFKSGAVRVLVATDIAARGIDVEGITHVINYDFPLHSEDYVHRIGRTGRAQASGEALSFVTPEDEAEVRAVERLIHRTIPRQQASGFSSHAAAPAPKPAQNNPSQGRPLQPAQHPQSTGQPRSFKQHQPGQQQEHPFQSFRREKGPRHPQRHQQRQNRQQRPFRHHSGNGPAQGPQGSEQPGNANSAGSGRPQFSQRPRPNPFRFHRGGRNHHRH